MSRVIVARYSGGLKKKLIQYLVTGSDFAYSSGESKVEGSVFAMGLLLL